jgi:hypothetical protein
MGTIAHGFTAAAFSYNQVPSIGADAIYQSRRARDE